MQHEQAAADNQHLTPHSRVLVVLCTYNEVQNLPQVVESLQLSLPLADLLVVDDSSPDGTGLWVSQHMSGNPRLHLLSRSGKLGLGSALLAGMRWCLHGNYDFLINLDADLSHDPAAAPALLAGCQSVDVAVGSRYIEGGGFAGLAWHRRWLSRTLNGYATRILCLPLSDCSGSFRCYRVQTLRDMGLEGLTCRGYGFLEEILVQLHRHGAKFKEVPIVFQARSSGHSKLSLKDAIGAFQVIHRLALRRK